MSWRLVFGVKMTAICYIVCAFRCPYNQTWYVQKGHFEIIEKNWFIWKPYGRFQKYFAAKLQITYQLFTTYFPINELFNSRLVKHFALFHCLSIAELYFQTLYVHVPCLENTQNILLVIKICVYQTLYVHVWTYNVWKYHH